MTNDNMSFEDFAPDREKQFVSIGSMCQLLQILPGQLRVCMTDCGVRFSLVIDGAGYLTVADAEAVAARCGALRREIENAQAKAEHAASN